MIDRTRPPATWEQHFRAIVDLALEGRTQPELHPPERSRWLMATMMAAAYLAGVPSTQAGRVCAAAIKAMVAEMAKCSTPGEG